MVKNIGERIKAIVPSKMASQVTHHQLSLQLSQQLSKQAEPHSYIMAKGSTKSTKGVTKSKMHSPGLSFSARAQGDKFSK